MEAKAALVGSAVQLPLLEVLLGVCSCFILEVGAGLVATGGSGEPVVRRSLPIQAQSGAVKSPLAAAVNQLSGLPIQASPSKPNQGQLLPRQEVGSEQTCVLGPWLQLLSCSCSGTASNRGGGQLRVRLGCPPCWTMRRSPRRWLALQTCALPAPSRAGGWGWLVVLGRLSPRKSPPTQTGSTC